MNYRTLAFSALALIAVSTGFAQTDRISSVSIGTASTAGGTANGVAIVTERIGTPLNQAGSVRNDIAGLQYVPGQIPLDGSPASIAFFTLSSAAIPSGGGPATSFTSYGTLITPTAVTTYGDVASKLTPGSYAALTFAEANLGFGSRAFYAIHHKPGTDYLAEIVPGTATSSAIFDLKPMSWTGPTAGGPASPGASGYFGLAWATGILSAGAPYADESLYYLRTDAGSHTQFGVMIPALTGASADTLDLTTAVGSYGAGGYTTLAFSPSVIGNYPAKQFYYLRQDSITGNTILGRLNPSLIAGTRTISDIANLGGVFDTLNFAADATGPAGAWGTSQFYITGALVADSQSISFEAIPDHNVGDIFAVTPTASSNLDIDVTVVSGPATIQTTGVSGATPLSLRGFTITTTGPGIVTLQARQAGRATPLPAYTANLLQQSFRVAGLPTITSASSAPATVGSAFTFSIASTGSPTSYSASPLPAGVTLNSTTGVISGTPTASGTTVVTVRSTNPSGNSSPANLTITVAAAAVTPVISSATTSPATVGSPFTFSITASGSPTSYSASPLPAGVTLNSTTGVISGTPTTSGTTVVNFGATNSGGTGTGTLTITVGTTTVSPVFTSPSATAGQAGTPFTYQIAATGLPTSYFATGLPPGLTLNSTTGAISGTPTVGGTYAVTLSAANSAGTRSTTWTVTIAAAPGAPVITSPASAPGTVGSPFPTFAISATGVPTSYTATGLPAGLSVNPVTGAITGTPTQSGVFQVTIQATNANGTTSSTLEINVAAQAASRIVNFSARALSGPGSQTLIVGFVVSGNGKNLLLRGIGPSLASQGVVNFLADPMLTLFDGSTALSTNDDWQNTKAGAADGPMIAATAARVGAFALPNLSKDAALLLVVNNGAHTTGLVRPNSTTGIALTEIYDTDIAAGAKLVNVSARMYVTPGEGTLIAGLVIGGGAPKAILIRGIGPTLSTLGVDGVLADPIITVYSGGTAIASNDNWSQGTTPSAEIVAAAARLGAFALPAGSRDAAVLLTLQPGNYTVHVSGLPNTTGVALVEIYDAD